MNFFVVISIFGMVSLGVFTMGLCTWLFLTKKGQESSLNSTIPLHDDDIIYRREAKVGERNEEG